MQNLIVLKKLGNLGVQIPAGIIERVGKSCNGLSVQTTDLCKTEYDIRDLHAGVIDIVLHFNINPLTTNYASQSVTEASIAQMTNVCRFVGVDTCVLNDLFYIGTGRKPLVIGDTTQCAKDLIEYPSAVKENVQIPGAGDLPATYTDYRVRFKPLK